jgi:D-lactate dehydrogenase
MKVAVFSTKSFDRTFLEAANAPHGHELIFFESRLSVQTMTLAAGVPVVCVFVNDQLNEAVLTELAGQGTRMIALRCAGFNNVDLPAAQRLGLTVARVPAYSPHAVAEHTVALMLALNRKIHRAVARVRDGNFDLDGLLGFDLFERAVGIVGTGKIGACVAQIMNGFGCHVLAYDPFPNPACEAMRVAYVSLPELYAKSDIITLHLPLKPETHHLIDEEALRCMRPGVMLINTSRGALIDTRAIIHGLKTGKIGSLGLDVYEEEADLFFEDLSNQVLQDDVFARLLTFPNVIITGHQAFFTENALENIAETTIANITDFEYGRASGNEISASQFV